MMKLVGDPTERGTQREDSTLVDGMVAMAQFRVSGTNSEARYYLESAAGQRWGVYAKSDGSLVAQYDTGGGWADGKTLFTAGNFLRDIWYVLILAVDDDGEFLARAWQRGEPELEGYYQCTMASAPSWGFKMTAKNGAAWLDAYSEGNLYTLDHTFYDSLVIPTATITAAELVIAWTYAIEARSYTFEGDGEFVARRSTYAYSASDQTSYGNRVRELEAEWDAGEGKWRDYRMTHTGFFPNTGAPYLVGLPANTNYYKCPENSFDGACSSSYPYPSTPPHAYLMSSTHHLYDNHTIFWYQPTAGIPTGQRRLLRFFDPINFLDPRFLDEKYIYDAWGNRTQVITYNTEGLGSGQFGLGNPQTITTTFETTYHTFAIAEENDLRHTSSYTYDYDLGLPMTLTGPNGGDTIVTVDYDDFGRLLKVVRPGDDGDHPTMQFGYYDTASPFYIELRQRIEGDQYAVFQRYYNGLGQMIQAQTEDAVLAQGLKDIVVDTWYDHYGRVNKQSVPYAITPGNEYHSPDSQPATATAYDILGRMDTVTAPNTVDIEYKYLDLESRVKNGRDNTTRYLNDVWRRTGMCQ